MTRSAPTLCEPLTHITPTLCELVTRIAPTLFDIVVWRIVPICSTPTQRSLTCNTTTLGNLRILRTQLVQAKEARIQEHLLGKLPKPKYSSRILRFRVHFPNQRVVSNTNQKTLSNSQQLYHHSWFHAILSIRVMTPSPYIYTCQYMDQLAE